MFLKNNSNESFGNKLSKSYLKDISAGKGGSDNMPYKINNDCIFCGVCAEECPVDAISVGDGKYVIDQNLCISCGACAAICPVGAPSQE